MSLSDIRAGFPLFSFLLRQKPRLNLCFFRAALETQTAKTSSLIMISRPLAKSLREGTGDLVFHAGFRSGPVE